MERHEIIELMGQLKLAGMRAAYDEVITAGLRAQHPVQRIIGELLLAQLADNRARSTAYRMGVARFPMMKNLAEFDFTVSPVNQGLVRELHEGGFLATQRNAVLIGGTGTGKSHVSIAIGANCVRNGARVRFFTAVDLVSQTDLLILRYFRITRREREKGALPGALRAPAIAAVQERAARRRPGAPQGRNISVGH